MPTYEYVCKKCGYTFEELQMFSEPPLKRCPRCNTDNLAKAIGTGSGLIFKGTGFYLTDYKRSNSSTSAGAKKDQKPDKKADAKQGTKPEKTGKNAAET